MFWIEINSFWVNTFAFKKILWFLWYFYIKECKCHSNFIVSTDHSLPLNYSKCFEFYLEGSPIFWSANNLPPWIIGEPEKVPSVGKGLRSKLLRR